LLGLASVIVVLLLLVFLVLGNPREVQAAELISEKVEARRTGASAELTTVSGDHLRGRAVRLDCHGISIDYFGNSLRVPLSKVATVTSEAEVPVFPGNGRDKIIGKLTVNAGVVWIAARDLGRVELPISAFRCNAKATTERTFADATLAGKDTPKPSARTQADEEKQPEGAAGGGPRSAGLEPRAGKLAAISGKGVAPAGEQRVDERNGSTSLSPTPQTYEPASPKIPPTSQKDTNPDKDVTAPPVSDNSPIAKEQQQETERNTLEFLRNEVVLVQPRKIETDFSISYLHTSQQIGNERGVIGSAQGRYGFSEGFEGFLAIPYTWGQRQTLTLNGTTSNENAGIGDIRFGLKYNIIQESHGIPVVVVGASSVAPTGHHPYAQPISTMQVLGDIRDPLSIQVGTGHWQLNGSVTALKSNDPLVLYATINYTHLIPATYYGVQIVPGDVWELNSGFGFAVNDTATISAQVFIDYVEKWKFNNGPVSQTGTTPINLKLSYTHVLSPTDIIQPSIVFGVTRDATDAVVSLDYIHRF
jgi:hypothetical protein